MTQEPFVIERTFNAPVKKVWEALTDNEQMKQWYFDIASFKAEVGFEFQFEGGSDAKRYLHLCKITEVVPEKKLAYIWRYEGYEGSSVVTFELFKEGSSTRVKLTHEGLETFPKGNPDFAKESFTAGWTYIIGTSLREVCAGVNTEMEVIKSFGHKGTFILTKSVSYYSLASGTDMIEHK